ncbi:MAG: EAL domain-containing protein [Pseudomonadota bacterium]
MHNKYLLWIGASEKTVYLRHFLIAASIYAITLPLVGFAYVIGLVGAWPFIIAVSFATVFNGLLAFVFLTKRNLRFADPGLANFQTTVAIGFAMFLAYSFNHDRALALFMCFLVLLFGIFRFNTREFVFTTLVMLAGYALVINLLMQFKPDKVDVYLEWYQWLTLALVLPLFALIGGRVSEIRMQMAKSNEELMSALSKIQEMASHDSLTGLPNRMLLNENLRKAIFRAERAKMSVGLLFIDLDNFKQINDTLGHPLGDSVLREVARRFLLLVRQGDTLARMGGDEFVLLIEDIADITTTSAVAEKLLLTLENKMRFEGHDVVMSASIGIAVYPFHGLTPTALISNADIAMYEAKSAGRNRACVFSSGLSDMASEKFKMDTDLRQAIAREEFVLHFQPKVDVHSGQAVGVEALIRWQHPEFGLVMPNRFLAVAEERGHIMAIGRWVLKTAFEKLKKWEMAGLPPMTMSVNISSIQLMHPGFIEDCASILKEARVSANLIELEITESVLMQNPARATEVLLALGELGFRLAVDDFGTGYSSLAYLKLFPVNTLKVDQSFVRDLPHNQDDVAITRAVIAMAHSLKMNVVAEGVERIEQLDLLRTEGCNEFQGYYCAKALPEAELMQFYKDQRKPDKFLL